MIYIFTALRAEALAFIRNQNLKAKEGPFQIYRNDEQILAVTGTGPLSAAAAVSSILSLYPPGAEDFLINAGIAAGISNAAVQTVYRIHRIRDLASGRDFYPDLLITSSIPEASVITGSRICACCPKPDQISREELLSVLPLTEEEPLLYDMEAAGVIHAASRFLAPHQICILKAVSDEGKPVTSDDAAALSEKLYTAFLEELPCMKAQCVKEEIPSAACDSLAEDLHASVTMRRSLSQLLYYCELAGIPYRSVLDQYYENGRLPASNRQEGKLLLDEIRHALLC